MIFSGEVVHLEVRIKRSLVIKTVEDAGAKSRVSKNLKTTISQRASLHEDVKVTTFTPEAAMAVVAFGGAPLCKYVL